MEVWGSRVCYSNGWTHSIIQGNHLYTPMAMNWHGGMGLSESFAEQQIGPHKEIIRIQ